MKHTLIAIALCSLLVATAACKRDGAEAPAAPPADAAAAPADANAAAEDAHRTDVISEVDHATPPADFDVKGFAGVFAGTLPCADCPGIDTRLELKADGTYALRETYLERKAEPLKSDGTWTLEAANKHIRLDPNSKDEQDGQFEILGKDELRKLDIEGKPIESSLPYNLKRSAG
ncbi:copper resistance protein NlpE [Luteimonas aquatica]|uniref:copper resistance protein NlpE n=1 Tax=Luteimonas aquatica TaxID=450364 RepID=UPI001F574006|nr:copper resistance protein NlpE [Luteimonas aquatica]